MFKNKDGGKMKKKSKIMIILIIAILTIILLINQVNATQVINTDEYKPNQTEEQRKIEMENKYNTLILNDVNQITSTKEISKYTVKVDISEITHRVYKITCNKIN